MLLMSIIPVEVLRVKLVILGVSTFVLAHLVLAKLVRVSAVVAPPVKSLTARSTTLDWTELVPGS